MSRKGEYMEGYKVQICIDADGDYYWEDFSGIVHESWKDASDEMNQAQDDPKYAGYEFMVVDADDN